MHRDSTFERDVRVATQEIVTIYRDLSERCVQLMGNFAEVLQPLMDEFVTVAKGVYETVWDAYREAGTIYGNDDDGLMRWLNDLNEIRTMEIKIEYIRSTHAGMKKLSDDAAAKREEALKRHLRAHAETQWKGES